MTMRSKNQIAGLMLVWALSGVVLPAAPIDDPENVARLKATKQCIGCNFQDAQLQAIDASAANVQRSDFTGANLYKADFRGANLNGATFVGANLTGANLLNAKGASLIGATTTESTTCPDGTQGPCR